tara:strand:- start:61 stop:828 length:768 start_codon:yes stop_codon:yes gene_type:complete
LIALYDHSFEGFLTVLFEVFEYRWNYCEIQKQAESHQNLFDEHKTIITQPEKSQRVWKGLEKVGSKKAQRLTYRVFLSELKGVENLLLQFVQKLFETQGEVVQNPADVTFREILKIDKMIGREKHRMDAFIRFRETKDHIYFATISPDFNVLPLNIPHFRKRYADQKWMIYDVKRNYGFFYNLYTVEEVVLETISEMNVNTSFDCLYFSEEEKWFQELWKTYFQHTNISERKNSQLHIKHVPKRYWKYLIEKNVI